MKIKHLKLSSLADSKIREKEMNALVGGNACSCACYYASEGPSHSTSNNMNANYAYGYSSVVGCAQYIKTDDWPNGYYWEHSHA